LSYKFGVWHFVINEDVKLDITFSFVVAVVLKQLSIGPIHFQNQHYATKLVFSLEYSFKS